VGWRGDLATIECVVYIAKSSDAVGTTRGVQKYFACKNRENTPHTSVSTALGRRVAGGSRCMRSESVSVDMVVLLVPK
jgi:hypothetical protein